MRYPRFALLAVLALVSVPVAWGEPQAELVLHFVEIGRGDCTLIECLATGWPWDADGDGVVEPLGNSSEIRVRFGTVTHLRPG